MRNELHRNETSWTPPGRQLIVSRRAMACEFTITIPNAIPTDLHAACAALDEVERIEALLSVFQPGSELSRLNAAAGEPLPLSGETFEVLRLALSLSAATSGTYDAAAGALVRAWGFSGGTRRVPGQDAVSAALAHCGSQHVRLDPAARTVARGLPGIEFNLGGIGKGYALDRARRLLAPRSAALLEAGRSSLLAVGAPPDEPRGWPIDLADPARPGRRYARVWLRDRALGTSANDQNFVQAGARRFGHLLDPRTGRPAASGLRSATAIAPTAAEADALSTAFYVLGVERTLAFCRRHPRCGAVLVCEPGPQGACPVIRAGAVDMEVNS